LQGKEEWWGKDKVVVVVVEVRGMVAHNLISSAFFFINYYNRNKYIYILKQLCFSLKQCSVKRRAPFHLVH
jgi:hypothetical protein